MLFETWPAVTWSFPVVVTSFPVPNLAPMLGPSLPNPPRNALLSVPDLKNTLTVKPVTWAKYGSLIG